MTPAARFAALIEIVDAMQDGQLAGHALRRDLQKRRYAGSGDRQGSATFFGNCIAIGRACSGILRPVKQR